MRNSGARTHASARLALSFALVVGTHAGCSTPAGGVAVPTTYLWGVAQTLSCLISSTDYVTDVALSLSNPSGYSWEFRYYASSTCDTSGTAVRTYVPPTPPPTTVSDTWVHGNAPPTISGTRICAAIYCANTMGCASATGTMSVVTRSVLTMTAGSTYQDSATRRVTHIYRYYVSRTDVSWSATLTAVSGDPDLYIAASMSNVYRGSATVQASNGGNDVATFTPSTLGAAVGSYVYIGVDVFSPGTYTIKLTETVVQPTPSLSRTPTPTATPTKTATGTGTPTGTRTATPSSTTQPMYGQPSATASPTMYYYNGGGGTAGGGALPPACRAGCTACTAGGTCTAWTRTLTNGAVKTTYGAYLSDCDSRCIANGYTVTVSGSSVSMAPRGASGCTCAWFNGAVSGSGGIVTGDVFISSNTVQFTAYGSRDAVTVLMTYSGAPVGFVTFAAPGCVPSMTSLCGDGGTPAVAATCSTSDTSPCSNCVNGRCTLWARALTSGTPDSSLNNLLDTCDRSCFSNGYEITVYNTMAVLVPQVLSPGSGCSCVPFKGEATGDSIRVTGTLQSQNAVAYIRSTSSGRVSAALQVAGMDVGSLAFTANGCNAGTDSFCGDATSAPPPGGGSGAGDGGGSSNGGAIAGGVIGALVGVFVIGGAAVFTIQRRRAGSPTTQQTAVTATAPADPFTRRTPTARHTITEENIVSNPIMLQQQHQQPADAPAAKESAGGGGYLRLAFAPRRSVTTRTPNATAVVSTAPGGIAMVTTTSIQPSPAAFVPVPAAVVTSSAGVPAFSANPLHAAAQSDTAVFSATNSMVVAGRGVPATALVTTTTPASAASELERLPPGMRVGRPNEVSYTVVQKKCMLPAGSTTMTISDLELEMHKQEAPCNIRCCAARHDETTHMSHVRLIEHSRGARSCMRLTRFFLFSVAMGAIAGLIVGLFSNKDAEKIGAGVGVGIALFAILFIVWFLQRKAHMKFATDAAESTPIAEFLDDEGIRISQFKIEAALQASWAAWARFRGFRPVDALHPEKDPQAETATMYTERKCGAIPAGGQHLTIVDKRAAFIKKTRGFCNLACFTSATWEGFWTDDVHWVHFTRGNRTLRAFLSTFLAGISAGLIVAYAAFDSGQRSSGDATAPSVAAAVIVWLLALVRWFLSAITHLQFGISKAVMPEVRVPQISSWDTYAASTSAMLRRPADLTNAVTASTTISGKDGEGNVVTLKITNDITEIRTLNARNKCWAFCCFLCTDESAYRVRTSELKFVYASIASIARAVMQSLALAIVGIAATLVITTYVFKAPSRAENDRNVGIGCGVSILLALLRLLIAACCRKQMIVLGTPLSKPMTPYHRAMDALGMLDSKLKYTFRAEFRSLTMSPEETVKAISDAIRAARAKTRTIPGPAAYVDNPTGAPKLVDAPASTIIVTSGGASVVTLPPGAGTVHLVSAPQPVAMPVVAVVPTAQAVVTTQPTAQAGFMPGAVDVPVKQSGEAPHTGTVVVL